MMKNRGEVRERAVLIGVSAESMEEWERSTEESMEELAELLETAGGESRGIVMQYRSAPDARTYIGAGKVMEVKEQIEKDGCSLVVFDNELTASQARVLEKEIGVRVLDRSGLILDIFAERARTREGRLQVELAQYRYMLPRLTGMWTHLERQAGSGQPIGTRGPGEKQLETDRRHVRRRLKRLEEELEKVKRGRVVQRRGRQRSGVPTVAIVGYTNAGKSTLFNRLTQGGAEARDRLFDTLDTMTRRGSGSGKVLLTDTVGFIRKIPHQLIEAFKATLEELREAELILHVIDGANSDWEAQAGIAEGLMKELGVWEKPRIEVYNKSDISMNMPAAGENGVCVSAKTGEGIEELIGRIQEKVSGGRRELRFEFPYGELGALEWLYGNGEVLECEYGTELVTVRAECTAEAYSKYRSYVKEVEK